MSQFNNMPKRGFAIPLAIIGVSTIAWSLLFNRLDQPTDLESLHLFLSVPSHHTNMKSALEYHLGADGIRKVSITAMAPDSAYYAATLATVGIGECDLLVVPQSVLDSLADFNNFAPLSESTLLTYNLDVAQYDYYENEMTPYGIKVYEEQTNTNLLDTWMTFNDDEDYYLIVNANTVNAGDFSNREEETSDHSFVALSYLLKNDIE